MSGLLLEGSRLPPLNFADALGMDTGFGRYILLTQTEEGPLAVDIRRQGFTGVWGLFGLQSIATTLAINISFNDRVTMRFLVSEFS